MSGFAYKVYVLKPIIGALEWANKLPIQHAFDEIKRAIESPQYQAAINGLTSFAHSIDWQWLADLQTQWDTPHDSFVDTIPFDLQQAQILVEGRAFYSGVLFGSRRG